METLAVVALCIIAATIVVGALAGIALVWIDSFNQPKAEQEAANYTVELQAIQEAVRAEREAELAEHDKMKRTCTHCLGLRCWDWLRNGRVCGDDPTRAQDAGLLLGGHVACAVPS